MPYKPKTVELPEWITELSVGDSCLLDVLTEAWVAAQHARLAVRDRGDAAPHMCMGELESAEVILENIRTGQVRPLMLAKKAAQAVRKFDTARQCASFLERDNSPRFARERKPSRPPPAHRVRVLAAREDSALARRGGR